MSLSRVLCMLRDGSEPPCAWPRARSAISHSPLAPEKTSRFKDNSARAVRTRDSTRALLCAHGATSDVQLDTAYVDEVARPGAMGLRGMWLMRQRGRTECDVGGGKYHKKGAEAIGRVIRNYPAVVHSRVDDDRSA